MASREPGVPSPAGVPAAVSGTRLYQAKCPCLPVSDSEAEPALGAPGPLPTSRRLRCPPAHSRAETGPSGRTLGGALPVSMLPVWLLVVFALRAFLGLKHWSHDLRVGWSPCHQAPGCEPPTAAAATLPAAGMGGARAAADPRHDSRAVSV